MPSKVERWFKVSTVCSGLTRPCCIPGCEQGLCGQAGQGWPRLQPLGELFGCDPVKGHKGRSWFSLLPAAVPASATHRRCVMMQHQGDLPKTSVWIYLGFYLSLVLCCGVTVVSINMDAQEANLFQTRNWLGDKSQGNFMLVYSKERI